MPDAHTPLYVDVRDIAMAHILALENSKAEGQRYTVVGAQYSNQEVSFYYEMVANGKGCRCD